MTEKELDDLHYLLIRFKDQEKAGFKLSTWIDHVLDAVEAHPLYRKKA